MASRGHWRELYGQRSERKARLLDQLELQLEEMEAAAGAGAIEAQKAAARPTTVQAFERRRPKRKPFPEHLPRERVVVEAPTTFEIEDRERRAAIEIAEMEEEDRNG